MSVASVLVLDDERAICEAFEQLLTSDGHTVALAGTGSCTSTNAAS